jgi:hypothetical protein
VQHRDALAETRTEAPDRLRRQGDLRHEHDRTQAALHCLRARAQVDLGLAAARGAVQEQVRARSGVHGRDDARQRPLLLAGQRGGRVLSAESVASAG